MKTKSIKIFRWILRVLSGILILFSLFMFIGETLDSTNPLSTNSIIQLSFAGIGLIGLGLAWKWELTGGIIALASFVAVAIINPMTLSYHLLFIFPATAILFIVLWVQNRNSIAKEDVI